MDRIKIDDLALEFGLTDEQLIDILVQNGIKFDFDSLTITKYSKDKFLTIFSNINSKKDKEHKNSTVLKSIIITDLFEENNNYKFDLSKDINIFVSENGEGKTTILNLIMAIFDNDWETINEINFGTVKIETEKKSFIISKYELNSIAKNGYNEFLMNMRRIITTSSYYELLNELNSTGKIATQKFELDMKKMIRNNPNESFLYRRVLDSIENIKSIQLSALIKMTNGLLESVGQRPLFYPTYRKIEAPKEKIFYRNIIKDIEITNKYISFGMKDVEDRINNIRFKLDRITSRAYSDLNGEIIGDLLTHNISTLIKDEVQIDKEKFNLVIKRIGKERIKNYETLEKVVNNETISNIENNDFLKFYINKIISIYDTQKALSERLLNFVNVCNKYLVNKSIEYNEANFSIRLFTKNKRKIELDDLSSGEKQIISIFSKVYLDLPPSSILIIDEPELSLSIEWQERFINDIYNSGKIGLLIATTHSPFIFRQNNLFEYTKDLKSCKQEMQNVNS